MSPQGRRMNTMTITERKTNPVTTAMLTRSLSEPEMEQATGGEINWKLIMLCGQLGIHDYVFTGKYKYKDHTIGCCEKYDVYMCSRCGALDYRNRRVVCDIDRSDEF